MSLANVLIPNVYNTYSNSLTMNSIAAQPIAGNNNLWINSSNNHLYRDGVDLEAIVPGPITRTDQTLFFPAYTQMYADNITSNDWLMAKDANGTLVLQLTSLGTAANLYLNPITNHSITALHGFKLTKFRVVYCNLTAMTSATATLNDIHYDDGVANSITNVPITGSFNTAASASNVTPFVSEFTITTPFYLEDGHTLELLISITSPGGNQTNVYGVFILYTTTF